MNIWKLLCFFPIFFATVVFAEEEDWKYDGDGPAAWEYLYPHWCAGMQQSPIPLSRDIARVLWPALQRQVEFHLVLENYGNAQKGIFVNDGKSAALFFNYTNISAAPHLDISYNGSTDQYTLSRLHFHWPSEHKINDIRYPLEMHMVHKDYNDKILVLSVLFTIDCHAPTVGLQTVGAAVMQVINAGDSLPIEDFAPVGLLPPFLQRNCGYYMFEGSLTTPPCSEGVLWLVHEDPLCIEKAQVESFKNLRDADGHLLSFNARSLQPLNNRPVRYLPCKR